MRSGMHWITAAAAEADAPLPLHPTPQPSHSTPNLLAPRASLPPAGGTKRQKPWCLQRLNSSMPPEELEAMWSSYLVFATVRNPYSRALGTYRNLTSRWRA